MTNMVADCTSCGKYLSCLLLFAVLGCSYGLATVVEQRKPLSLLSPTGGPSLRLKPMLGRYPPHRVSQNSPIPKEENLDSIIKDPQQVRTPFNPEGQVHILRSAWSPHECQIAVKAAAKYNKWSTGRHHLFPTTDIPASDLPEGMGQTCLDLAAEVILPHMALAFDTSPSSLYFKDMFLAKYEPTGQPGLGRHTDGSTLSFNMLLSEDFKGGGTWIEPVGLVRPLLGDVLMHRGDLLHEGCKVTKGSRYVLVGFVQSDADAEGKADESSRPSELLLKTVSNFQTLGMILEVDEGDMITCVMVTGIADDGAAAKAGVQEGDCIRGIYGNHEDTLVQFDGQSFDDVMDLVVGRKGLGALNIVIERWCSESVDT